MSQKPDLIKRNSFAYLMQIVVIIFSITASFALRSWNEQRKKSNLEMDMLEGILTDVSSNIGSLKEIISIDSSIYVNNKQLI